VLPAANGHLRRVQEQQKLESFNLQREMYTYTYTKRARNSPILRVPSSILTLVTG
jgi:hypothetical protein